MRFQRFKVRPSPIERTARRVRNAERSIQRERDDIPLFPELVRFKSVDERLRHLDNMTMAYWQRIRDASAKTWRKFRRRLYSLPEADIDKFLAYWNTRVMIPGEAHYASDTLTHFFQREDWRIADTSEIQEQGGGDGDAADK